MLLKYIFALLVLLPFTIHHLPAQTIINGDFQNGTTGWSGCIMERGTAATYGGPGSTNFVAEVDGNFDVSTADDRILCQSISGFTVGSIYTLSFDATRRVGTNAPTVVSVTVRLDGAALSREVTRTGGWNMVAEQLVFTATQPTHYLTIRPNFVGSHGMIFDNLTLSVLSALPVELISFDAVVVGEEVMLDWATGSEVNSAWFEVQRSTDMDTWSTVATLAAAGNSQQLLHYTHTDTWPLGGLSYYRLRQVDLDGTSELSAVRALKREAGARSLVLWPNPVSDVLQVHGINGIDARVEVFDALGRAVLTEQFTSNDHRVVSVAGLPSGHYTVRSSASGSPVARFIKE